jgi:hypothetical protein
MNFSKFELLKSLELKNQKYFELYQHYNFNPVQGPREQNGVGMGNNNRRPVME